MKRLITVLLLLGCAMAYGQSDTLRLHLLEKEENYFKKTYDRTDNHGVHLFYSLSYDDPNTWDEEFEHLIYFNLHNAKVSEYSLDSIPNYYTHKAVFNSANHLPVKGAIAILDSGHDLIKATIDVTIESGEHTICLQSTESFSREKH